MHKTQDPTQILKLDKEKVPKREFMLLCKIEQGEY